MLPVAQRPTILHCVPSGNVANCGEDVYLITASNERAAGKLGTRAMLTIQGTTWDMNSGKRVKNAVKIHIPLEEVPILMSTIMSVFNDATKADDKVMINTPRGPEPLGMNPDVQWTP